MAPLELLRVANAGAREGSWRLEESKGRCVFNTHRMVQQYIVNAYL